HLGYRPRVLQRRIRQLFDVQGIPGRRDIDHARAADVMSSTAQPAKSLIRCGQLAITKTSDVLSMIYARASNGRGAASLPQEFGNRAAPLQGLFGSATRVGRTNTNFTLECSFRSGLPSPPIRIRPAPPFPTVRSTRSPP